MSTASVMRDEMRVNSAQSLLIERVGVLLRSACRGLVAGLAQRKKQARKSSPAAGGGLFAAMMGRALAAKNMHSRMLAIEERLTLGPKQHMYLIRCGEQRLLVASAGEAALQWMTLPGESSMQAESIDHIDDGHDSATRPRAKRGTVSTRTGTGSKARSATHTAGANGVEGAR